MKKKKITVEVYLHFPHQQNEDTAIVKFVKYVVEICFIGCMLFLKVKSHFVHNIKLRASSGEVKSRLKCEYM